MLERLNQLSHRFAVSGCEEQMRSFLLSHLKEIGANPTVDETGCLYAKNTGSSRNKRKVIISVPMDVPGFLALYINKNYGYLSATSEMPENKAKSIKLMGEDGCFYNATLLTDSEKERRVYKKGIALADCFCLDPTLEPNQDIISGFFATTYARIQLLLDLAKEQTQNDVTFLFAASSSTRAAKERNAAKRINPDYMILIGAAKSEQTKPLLMIKDGNAFSNKELTKSFLALHGKNSFKTALFSDPITKAGEVHSADGVPILSLALPYSLKDGKECYSCKSYDSLFLGLKNFL